MTKILYADIFAEYPGQLQQSYISFSSIMPTHPCPQGAKRLCLTIKDWPELTVPLITRSGDIKIIEERKVEP